MSASPPEDPSIPRKATATALEIQRRQLDKLLANPEKDVYIPKPPKEKSLRPPREIIKVSSSKPAPLSPPC
jgi:hypothetical protein